MLKRGGNKMAEQEKSHAEKSENSNTEAQKKERAIFISLRVKLLIGFTLLFTIVFAIAFYWFYDFASERALSRIQEDLRNTLAAAANGVDAEKFISLSREGVPREDGYTDDPRYWEHARWLKTVHEIEPRAAIYTYIKSDKENEVIFIGSSGALENPPWGAKFLEHYRSKGPLLQGLKETIFGRNFKPYEDKYGRWVSGYTPIINKEGEPAGGLGIDFKADYVYEGQEAIQNRVFFAFSVTYMTLFVLVLFISTRLTRSTVTLTSIAERIGEGDYEHDLSGLSKGRFRDEIGMLAAVFGIMIEKVGRREKNLRNQVEKLKIEVDEAKRREQVKEIVDTDFFQDLQAKADSMRQRKKRLE
jgi:HAMP domain-containing protein